MGERLLPEKGLSTRPVPQLKVLTRRQRGPGLWGQADNRELCADHPAPNPALLSFVDKSGETLERVLQPLP